MKAETLKKAILQYAMQGKLVEQDPNDEPASVLLEKIKAEKEQLIKEGKIKKEKPLSPITEDEKPYDLPKGWEWVKLNEIAFVTKLAGFEYTKYIAENLVSKGIPLFKGKNVQNGNLIYDFENYIPENLSDELYRSQLNKKCLLTPYVGTIGNIAIFDGRYKCHLGSNVGKIELFNNFQKNILEEYVLYYLRSAIGLSELKKHKKATAQESISIEAIRDVIIALPPLAEQQRIVERLEQILPLVEEYGKNEEKLSKLNSTLPDKIKQSILQHAVQGKLVPQNPSDEPASVLLNRIKAEKEQLIKEGKIKKEKPLPPITEDEIPFQVPDSWEWVKLSQITSIIGDGIHGTPEYTLNTEYYFINGNNLNNGIIEIKDNTKTVSENEYLKYKKNLNERTVLVSINGTLGNVAFYNNEKVMLGKSACYFNLLSDINKLYLKLILNSDYFLKYADNKATGTTIKNVSLKAMQDLLIPLPPLAEQQRIVTKVEELLAIVDNLK